MKKYLLLLVLIFSFIPAAAPSTAVSAAPLLQGTPQFWWETIPGNMPLTANGTTQDASQTFLLGGDGHAVCIKYSTNAYWFSNTSEYRANLPDYSGGIYSNVDPPGYMFCFTKLNSTQWDSSKEPGMGSAVWGQNWVGNMSFVLNTRMVGPGWGAVGNVDYVKVLHYSVPPPNYHFEYVPDSMFHQCKGGTCDYTEYIESVCEGGELAGIVAGHNGNIAYGSLVSQAGADTAKWDVVPIRSGTAAATITGAFNTWGIWPGLTFTTHPTTTVESLVLSSNTYVSGLFFFCAGGSGTTPTIQEFRDNFTWVHNTDLTGFSTISAGSFTDLTNYAEEACYGVGSPAGNAVQISSAAQTPELWLTSNSAAISGNQWYLGSSYDLTYSASSLNTFLGSTPTLAAQWGGLKTSYSGASVRLKGQVTLANTDTLCWEGSNDLGELSTTGGSLLIDGDMEQQPYSTHWFPNTAYGPGDFGRLTNSNLLSVGYGDPRCGNGWQIIGGTTRCGWSLVEFYNDMCLRQFSAIRQQFTWPGGKMYWRFSARGLPNNGWDRPVKIQVWVTNTATNQQTVFF